MGALKSVETPSDEVTIDMILARVKHEIMKARRKHRPMAGAHEGKAVIEEELDELWDHVKADTGVSAAAGYEAIQVAAMGVRYVLDVLPSAAQQELLAR